MEPVFRLVEIFFRNRLVILAILLPPKTTFPSSENMIFNKSFIPAGGNLFFV